MALPKSFYVCDITSVVQGPFDAEELRRLYYAKGFEGEAQVNFDGGEWLPIAAVVSGLEELMTNNAASKFVSENLSASGVQQQRGLTIFDILIPALLWWWYSACHWHSVAALALGLTMWISGAVLRLVGGFGVSVLGNIIQSLGGLLGSLSILWLLVDVLCWLF